MKKIAILNVIFLMTVAVLCKAEDTALKIFKIKHGNAQSISKIADSLKSEKGKVTYDANSNSIILVDYPQNIERIGKVVESLDVLEKQVEIKVSVVEASEEFFKNIGISHAEVTIPSGKFTAILKAIEESKEATVKTEMTLRTQSNQPAQLQVSSDEFIGNEVTIYNSGTTVVSPIREPVGNFLEVLPMVNDGTITVIVRPKSSALGKDTSINEQTILTQAVINDGETIAIGAVDSEKQVDRNSRALLNMPLSSKTEAASKKVIMFLTAKIVD